MKSSSSRSARPLPLADGVVAAPAGFRYHASNPPRVVESEAALLAHADDLSSDDEVAKNTAGRVPREWYADETHVGYDVSGSRIERKGGARDGIDRFLLSQDDPLFKWTIYDEENDEEMVLSKRDVQMLRRMRDANFAHPEFNAYPDLLEIYSAEKEMHSLHGGTEPKRRFLPSRWEAVRVNSIVRAIKAGTFVVKKAPALGDAPPEPLTYLLWGESGAAIGYESRIDALAPPPLPAPKVPPPGHAASYNPPPEYLLTPEERAAWAAQAPSDRLTNFVPQSFKSLRSVPLYARGIKERFERCLDLYLCPRAEGKKALADPESLLPELPDPASLRPFPSALAFDMRGHKGRVRSVSIDPSGLRAASGGEDGTVRVWDLATGRCESVWDLGTPVAVVAWCPEKRVHIIAAAVENRLVLIYPGTVTTLEAAEATFAALTGAAASTTNSLSASKKLRESKGDDDDDDDDNDDGDRDEDSEGKSGGSKDIDVGGEGGGGATALRAATWSRAPTLLSTASDLLPRRPSVGGKGGVIFSAGPVVSITHPAPVRSVAWHRRGDYCAVGLPAAPTGQVLIHQVSKRATQCPFAKSVGAVQALAWHPSKPHIFVATQRTVRVYDLVGAELVQKLESGCSWLSSLGVHPSGDHILAGSYDHRTVWFDTDLGATPFKTLRYHASGVRRAAFHQGTLPLMATCSDDGTLHIFHAKVFSDDYSKNPVIVPVKILRGHTVEAGLGVLDFAWHPTQPWIVSCGADGNVKLWHALG
jgi:ribosome biogenesis protein ERB1